MKQSGILNLVEVPPDLNLKLCYILTLAICTNILINNSWAKKLISKKKEKFTVSRAIYFYSSFKSRKIPQAVR